jgi:hypothetical protein
MRKRSTCALWKLASRTSSTPSMIYSTHGPAASSRRRCRRWDGVAVALRRCAMDLHRGPTSPRIGLVFIDMKNAVKIFCHLLRCIERSWWCRTGGVVAAAQGLAGRRALLPCIRPSISMYRAVPITGHMYLTILVLSRSIFCGFCAHRQLGAGSRLEAAVDGRS